MVKYNTLEYLPQPACYEFCTISMALSLLFSIVDNAVEEGYYAFHKSLATNPAAFYCMDSNAEISFFLLVQVSTSCCIVGQI